MFAAYLYNGHAISYPDGPQVGEPAPSLNITSWLQTPVKALRGWPAGKVVVLEFWATTCAPCVEVIPHLNELAEKYQNQPVLFIAVTDDEKAVVQRFLKKNPIKAWIGLCPGGVFGETNAYRVAGIPHTVIINAQGRIAAVIDPRELTSAMLDQCLATKKMSSPNSEAYPGEVPGQRKAGMTPIYQMLIQPSAKNWLALPDNGTRSVARGLGLATLRREQVKLAISEVFGVPWTRVIAEVELPKENYDFYVTMPKPLNGQDGSRRLEAVFAQAIEATFGLSVKRETRMVSVLVLETNMMSARKMAGSTNPAGKDWFGPGEVCGSNKRLNDLAQGLEYGIAMPVFDETGLTNHYSFDVKWDQKTHSDTNVNGMIEAVQKLGLDLVRSEMAVELVVVRQAP